MRRSGLLLMAVLVSAACTGELLEGGGGLPGATGSGEPAPGAAPAGREPASPAGPPPAPGGAVAPPATDPPLPAGPAACVGASAPAPLPMRRLTNEEYAAAIRELFGSTARLAHALPAETFDDGFENGAASQALSVEHLTAYLENAEALTAALATDAKKRAAFYGCTPSGSTRATCVASVIASVGRRAFRRPLTAAEVESYRGLAAKLDADPDPFAALDAIVQSLLASPSFLFLPEVGTREGAPPGRVRLTGHELAARLAFWLWGGPPDEALLDDAASGRLDTAGGAAMVARRILGDPRAAAGRWAFFERWLRLGDLSKVMPDAAKVPAWTPALRDGYREETRRFVEDLAAGDGRTLLGLVGPGTTFVNAATAAIYGVAPPAAGAWRREDLTARGRGAGLLTQGSLLSITALGEASTPIRRGAYIREVLLCQRLPSPPAEVPSIDAVKVAAASGVRERLAAHRDVPACAGCHKLLDPVGFGLLGFDAIGRARTVDAWGVPIDTRGELVGAARETFAGPVELAARLRETGEVERCLAAQATRWALGRHLTDADLCALQPVVAAFARDGRWSTLAEAVAASDLFRHRITAGGTP